MSKCEMGRTYIDRSDLLTGSSSRRGHVVLRRQCKGSAVVCPASSLEGGAARDAEQGAFSNDSALLSLLDTPSRTANIHHLSIQ